MKILLWIVAAAAGIVLGACIGAALIVGGVRRKINREVGGPPKDLTPTEKAKLFAVTKEFKAKYRRSQKCRFLRRLLKLKPKKRELEKDEKLNYFRLITKTAEIFNPDSVEPWLEVSERELFGFAKSVTTELKGILDASGLSFLKSVPTSLLVDTVRLARKVLGHGVTKAAKKSVSVVYTVLNAVNPFFWIKRITSTTVILKICDHVVYASIEITAYKFAELYKNSSARYFDEKKQEEYA